MGAIRTASAPGGQALVGELPDKRPDTRLLTTEERFCDWVANALPGQILEYYRGSLIRDRTRSTSRLSQQERLALAALAKRVMQVAEGGCVLLVQRRHAESDYSYISIRTRHRRARAGRSTRATGNAQCRR